MKTITPLDASADICLRQMSFPHLKELEPHIN